MLVLNLKTQRFFKNSLCDERGSITIFTLVIFSVMLVAAGMAIDFMRHETVRSQVQIHLDRASLAAASLMQTRPPEEVVTEYLSTANLLNDITYTVQADTGAFYRVVEVSAAAEIDTFFLNMIGIDTLGAVAKSRAEERIPNVEISLVLDVSEDMNNKNRLTNMKFAVVKFINDMLDAGDTGQVLFNLVPYSVNVSVGEDLLNKFNPDSDQTYSSCVRFAMNDYNSTSILRTDPLVRLGHFYDSTDPSTNAPNYECPLESEGRSVVAFSNDRTELTNAVMGLTARGGKAIDLGMKWGVALLDPAARPIVTELIAEGKVSPLLAGRPMDWDVPDSEVLKIVIILTDGANGNQRDLRDEYKSGMSNMWFVPDPAGESTGTQTGLFGESGEYWAYLPNKSNYFNYNETTAESGEFHDDPISGTTGYNLTYPQLWNRFSVDYHAEKYYRLKDSFEYSKMKNAIVTTVPGSSADGHLMTSCNAARQNGALTLTIAIDSPGGHVHMRNCATTKSHFFSVSGSDIDLAFASILGNIQTLKLTQ